HLQAGAAPPVRHDGRGDRGAEPPHAADPAGRGGLAQVRREGARSADRPASGQHGVRLRHLVPAQLARRLRAPAARLHARGLDALHQLGRGGAGVGDRGPAHPRLDGRARPARQLCGRHLGAARGRRPHRRGRARVATAVAGAPSSARWSGEGVRIGEVAARLADLRHGLAPEGAVPARTSVLNLIAWAPDEAAAAEMEDVVDHLADHHPSRAVILTTAPGGDGIDAQAEAAVRRATDGRPVEVERVVLTLRGGVVEHAASAVIPLLRSDLTTFLWWPGRPDAAHPVMRDLGGVADRVVPEAARDADGPEAAAALADLAGADGPAVTDLAWAEVTAWRQTVALTIRGAVLRSLQEGNAAIRVAG